MDRKWIGEENDKQLFKEMNCSTETDNSSRKDWVIFFWPTTTNISHFQAGRSGRILYNRWNQHKPSQGQLKLATHFFDTFPHIYTFPIARPKTKETTPKRDSERDRERERENQLKKLGYEAQLKLNKICKRARPVDT